jgi:hypothetical protein
MGPFCKKAPFRLYFQLIFRSHFSKSKTKSSRKGNEKEPKMATVNDPNDTSLPDKLQSAESHSLTA